MSVRSNKPSLLFVFAHPDDDAFGPSGTLIKMAADFDIHFLCATRGEYGDNNTDIGQPVAQIRENEVRASASLIGAKSINFLDFVDGDLCNNVYHTLASKIQEHIDALLPTVLMTWEPKGVTGHIDHMVVSMVCHYVFGKNPNIQKLMLYCLSSYQTKQFLDDYFIYRPPGYSPKDIDLVVDISDVWEKKLAAIKCHASQVKDFQKIMNRPRVRLMEDCFIILEKEKK